MVRRTTGKRRRKGDARKVRKVTLVLQPLARRRNLIRRALAPNPQQTPQVLEFELRRRVGELFGGEVRVEGSEELETGRSGRNDEFGGGVGSGGRAREVGGVTCEKE